MSEGGETRRADRIVRECGLHRQTTGILAALAHALEKQHAARSALVGGSARRRTAVRAANL